MKVLQLGKFYPIRGGVEKVMYDLTEGLGRAGVKCDMLCATNELPKSGEQQLNENARVIYRKALAKVAATMIAPSLITYLRRHCAEYDIIHVHHPDPMAALALFLSGYKGRVIVHWHSDIVKQKFILFFYKPLQNWMLRRASGIVGTSPVYVSESPHLKAFQDKVTYLPIGVDKFPANDAVVESIRRKYAGKKLIFSLGRFVEYKGYEYLVRAAALLPENYCFVIGGEGPLKSGIEALAASLGISDRVGFPGWMGEDERRNWFAACDLFALSSIYRTEAFAIVQIEAMSFGKPLVSTRIPGSGVAWVNADGVSGRTVPVMDSKALAEAIYDICQNPEIYSSCCSGSSARFEELFTREKMIDGCKDIYQQP